MIIREEKLIQLKDKFSVTVPATLIKHPMLYINPPFNSRKKKVLVIEKVMRHCPSRANQASNDIDISRKKALVIEKSSVSLS